MYKVHMHAGAIRKLLYGFVSVWAIIHSLKLVDYLLRQTHKPYNNQLITPMSDIPMFYIKYLTMHMHACAIRQLLYGCAYAREIIHSLKLMDYPPVQTHKQYNNFCLYHGLTMFSVQMHRSR